MESKKRNQINSDHLVTERKSLADFTNFHSEASDHKLLEKNPGM